MCAKTHSLTITGYGNAQHIPQIVLDGVTLYQDRVYISLEEIYAWTNVWSLVGVDAKTTPHGIAADSHSVKQFPRL